MACCKIPIRRFVRSSGDRACRPKIRPPMTCSGCKRAGLALRLSSQSPSESMRISTIIGGPPSDHLDQKRPLPIPQRYQAVPDKNISYNAARMSGRQIGLSHYPLGKECSGSVIASRESGRPISSWIGRRDSNGWTPLCDNMSWTPVRNVRNRLPAPLG